MPAWAIVLIVLGAVVAGLCGIGALASIVKDDDRAAAKDVSIVSCGASGGSFDLVGPKATIEITNRGSRTASYSVDVEFVDGSTRLGTGTASVYDLAPGQTEQQDAASFAGGKGTGTFECKVTQVRKY